MIRDLTKSQFEAACGRRGFKRAWFGYYDIGHGVSVYARNAGDRRRDQLAYLIRQAAARQAELDNDESERQAASE